MYRLLVTKQFKKDYKKCIARKFDISSLNDLIYILEKMGTIPGEFKPHPLKGGYKHHWECHIRPDWLLIWLPDHQHKTIKLVRNGTHNDLF